MFALTGGWLGLRGSGWGMGGGGPERGTDRDGPRGHPPQSLHHRRTCALKGNREPQSLPHGWRGTEPWSARHRWRVTEPWSLRQCWRGGSRCADGDVVGDSGIVMGCGVGVALSAGGAAVDIARCRCWGGVTRGDGAVFYRRRAVRRGWGGAMVGADGGGRECSDFWCVWRVDGGYTWCGRAFGHAGWHDSFVSSCARERTV
jgi:hypothetical protein